MFRHSWLDVRPPHSSASYRISVRESINLDCSSDTSNHPPSQHVIHVILLHGMVVSGTYMEPLGEALAPWFKVWIPDLPGYGNSCDALPNYHCLSVQQLADVVVGFIEATNMLSPSSCSYSPRAPVLIGNSMGCQLVADVAARYPKYVSTCIMQGPTKGANLESSLIQVAHLLWNGRNERPSMMLIMVQDYLKSGLFRCCQTLMKTRDYHLETTMHKITCPALLVTGEVDNVSSLSWNTELQKRCTSSNVVLILDAPHTVNYTLPHTFATICREYILSDQQTAPWTECHPRHEQLQLSSVLMETLLTMTSTLLLPLLLLGLPWISIFTIMSIFLIVYISRRYYTRHWVLQHCAQHHIPFWPRDITTCPRIPCAADFDSATGFLRATAYAIKGHQFHTLGRKAPIEHVLAWILNRLSSDIRSYVYSVMGAAEATSASHASKRINSIHIAEAVVAHYSQHRRYPIIAVGSSNGALTHLYAAMGIPWLPNTVLCPIRRSYGFGRTHSVDKNGIYDFSLEKEWSRAVGAAILNENPDFELHHMADPNQDLLMTRWMSYFRFKRLCLGKVFEQFIQQTLEPGGVILLIDDAMKWPCVKLGNRHYFQMGAFGGLSPPEYIEPNATVDRFIRSTTKLGHAEQDKYLHWNSPQPDCEVAEAEWGMGPEMVEDVLRFARSHDYRVQQLTYHNPDDVSPMVADLYRVWYQKERSIPRYRLKNPDCDDSQHSSPVRDPTASTESAAAGLHLAVGSFVLIEPWWCIHAGMIPFWTTFPVKRCVESFRHYLEKQKQTPSFPLICSASVTLLSHGVRSANYSPAEMWQAVLDQLSADYPATSSRNQLVGFDPAIFPQDYQSMLAFSSGHPSVCKERYPMPTLPLSVQLYTQFMHTFCVKQRQYQMRWKEIEIRTEKGHMSFSEVAARPPLQPSS